MEKLCLKPLMCLKSKWTFSSCWLTESQLRIKCTEYIWISWTCSFCYASRLLLWSWPLLKFLTFLRTGNWKLERQVLLFPTSWPSLPTFFLSPNLRPASSHTPIYWSFSWNQDSLISWKIFHLLHILHFTWLSRIQFFQKYIFFLKNTWIKLQIILKAREL